MDSQITSNNSNTGSGSTNQSTTSVASNSSTSVTNSSNVTNSFNFTVDTGHNNVAGNTTAGDVTTGDTLIHMHADTQANTGTYAAASNGGTLNYLSSNSNTGSGSTNTSTASFAHNTALTVNNSSHVTNAYLASVTTGGNNLNNNTTVGSLHTGSVTIIAGATTVVNGPGTPPATPVPTPLPTPESPVPIGVIPFGRGGEGIPAGSVVLASAPGYFPSGANVLGSEALPLLVAVVAVVFASGPLAAAARKLNWALLPFGGRL
ncbi:MAG: hypothetical protein WCO52_04025 [bacterium]